MRPHTLYLPSTAHHPSLRGSGQVIDEQILPSSFSVAAASLEMPREFEAGDGQGCSGTAGESRCAESLPEMLCGAADFISAHCNPTTMKPLELGPEPAELGNVTELTFMGTNSTVCG